MIGWRSPIAGVISFVLAVIIAMSTASAATPHQAFALIVTNNRSGALGRPDLQYADDDGARYYELFLTLAPADHLRLLTEFDRDSARVFSRLEAVATPPSRANVQAAARDLARQVAAARATGATVDFYFVFAGHGDVDHGRGFLELGDGAFYGDDLQAVIAAVGASRSHVILDSCNSYFVINARKPGGRRFATPVDAAASLVQRTPDVGVFVSTSADAEVFEWSELQSGVFSHAVRSGLAGAADADGDGAISYDELRAFVDTATAEIHNDAFRPKVFARGPSGNDRTPLFEAPTTGQQLTLDASRAIRLTVRDREEMPWIDVYKEAGVPLTLRLPPGLTGAHADELAVDRGEVARIRRSEVPDDAPRVSLHDLPTAPSTATARGPDQLFRRLFTLPFGPAALARYDAERTAAPPPVFGLSHEETSRMAHLLEEVDHAQREYRWVSGALGVALGGAAIAAGAATPGYATHAAGDGLRVGLYAGGSALVVLGVYQLLRDPAAEHLHTDLAAGLASHAELAPLLANIDQRLHQAARTATRSRWLVIGSGAVLLASSGAAFVFGKHDASDGLLYTRSLITAGAAVGAMAIFAGSFETQVERTTRLWDRDLGTETPRLGVVPMPGGAGLALSGGF